MTDILDQIYYGEYSGQSGASRVYRKLMAEGEPLWEAVYAAAGQETADRLQSNQCALQRVNARDSFKEGFRLGDLLMLDLLYGEPGSVYRRGVASLARGSLLPL